ncbi:MAG: DNA alkylation repair protein [Vicinamibacteria bacterium]|nr:DNA alkylation repair protein [Vicinamibacteria bacterium]
MATKSKTPAAKPPKPAVKSAAARMSLNEVMSALEKVGTEQARKTYTRHGGKGPMFGVSFADLKILMKRIKVDHELAQALWNSGNLDARNLAVKVADPLLMSAKDLDAWASDDVARMCGGYVAHLAAEGPHGRSRADAWLAARSAGRRVFGWLLAGVLAMRDEDLPADWFIARLATIEKDIHAAPNAEREAMNGALISIGCRDAGLRKAAMAAAKRIGPVEVDHGDTDCKTPLAADSIEKAWAYSIAKGFASPAAQERGRESTRTRC